MDQVSVVVKDTLNLQKHEIKKLMREQMKSYKVHLLDKIDNKVLEKLCSFYEGYVISFENFTEDPQNKEEVLQHLTSEMFKHLLRLLGSAE